MKHFVTLPYLLSMYSTSSGRGFLPLVTAVHEISPTCSCMRNPGEEECMIHIRGSEWILSLIEFEKLNVIFLHIKIAMYMYYNMQHHRVSDHLCACNNNCVYGNYIWSTTVALLATDKRQIWRQFDQTGKKHCLWEKVTFCTSLVVITTYRWVSHSVERNIGGILIRQKMQQRN